MILPYKGMSCVSSWLLYRCYCVRSVSSHLIYASNSSRYLLFNSELCHIRNKTLQKVDRMVTNRALTYVNSSTPLKIIENEIDLDKCYGDKEIVVKVHAAAFNPIDFILHDFANKWLVGSKPKTVGRDYSGEIVRVGEKVNKEWAVGDKVCGLFDAVYNEQGAMRDYLVFDPESSRTKLLTKLPEFHDAQHSDYVLGASWPLVFTTAIQGFTDYGQKFGPDSNILVLGASTSVGFHVIKIAKELYNVNAVVGTCNSKSFERNKEVGCDYCIAYDTEDIPARLKEIIADELKGQKFDLIFDCAGYNDLIPHINDYLKPKNQNSQYINITGTVKYQFDPKKQTKGFIWKSLLGMCRFHRSFNYHFLLMRTERSIGPKFKEFLSNGHYHPPIDSVTPLDQYKIAETKMRSYGAKGKMVISFE